VTEATPVDPAIMARFKKVGPFQERLAALRNKLLIEKGRQLFMNEKFNGNGRTCGTCHPLTNNFTIDKEFIADLFLRNPRDPLFVAEFEPALAQLENPVLMHEFGLILENLDGFGNPGVMRGVPHTLALPTSIAPDDDDDSDQVRANGKGVVHALGWSADGSPGDGSLREFAIGAVMQHFPKTLKREPGSDFRLPTEAELDALEAFQLSLGRQKDLNLVKMTFADDDVETGKDLFNDGVGAGAPTCAFCHNNAGANVAEGFNDNFATNVARRLDAPARLLNVTPPVLIPGDGGFDTTPTFEVPGIFQLPGQSAVFRGNGTMNVPPLVEAADSGPFFHNNSAQTIEDAVTFYTTDTFSTDPTFKFVLSTDQANQIGAFLRSINALENIRSSNELAQAAQGQLLQARQTIRERVIPDTGDAIEVLADGPLNLYPEAVALLREALDLETDASDAAQRGQRNALLRQAIKLKTKARDDILQ
jgi:cytochrome c peroxidase